MNLSTDPVRVNPLFFFLIPNENENCEAPERIKTHEIHLKISVSNCHYW